jgi:uncharacterized protein YjbJ (UPF0337 family)
MDQDQLSGTAKNISGKAQESVGRTTGDTSMLARGQMMQAEGRMQELYGRAQESAAGTADPVRAVSNSVEDSLRDFVENKPYTTAAIALAVGWIVGRAHRPF